MTALRPHPPHETSLLIALGLLCPLIKIPAFVMKEEPELIRVHDKYHQKDKDRFIEAVAAIVKGGEFSEFAIISYIEADEENNDEIIFPRGKKYGRKPPEDTIRNWIRVAKRKYNLIRPLFMEQVVQCALEGKTIQQAIEIVGCKRSTALNVYNALEIEKTRYVRKNKAKVDPEFRKVILGMAEQYKKDKENGISK